MMKIDPRTGRIITGSPGIQPLKKDEKQKKKIALSSLTIDDLKPIIKEVIKEVLEELLKENINISFAEDLNDSILDIAEKRLPNGLKEIV